MERNRMRKIYLCAVAVTALFAASISQAAIITDPNDPRIWQGADIGTFALKFYGADTLANRQLVVDNMLMDDSVFDASGFITASLVETTWVTGGGGCHGTSHDTTGTGSYVYTCSESDTIGAANAVDNKWFQSSGTAFDLGFQASKAAIFNSIDHGPLPGEAIESTVYLSNDQVTWTQAVVERVWMEGNESNLGILWDGFTYAVGTGTSATFRYASVIHGGPCALRVDGDDEINAIMGLKDDFTPTPIPAPAPLALLAISVIVLARKQLQRAIA